MENRMFCRQCQETCRNTGCTRTGMCGKTDATSNLMDQLLQQLQIIALTRRPDRNTARFAAHSLFMTVTNANFDPARIAAQLNRAKELADSDHAGLVPPPDENVRSLRELLICGLKGIAAYAEHAAILGKEDDAVRQFLFKALAAGAVETSVPVLLELVMEAGTAAVKTMAMLDEANTAAFGTPEITTVRTGTGIRPGILVSGHDLLDLKELLMQTADAEIDVYTHGEMLPAHAYPGLKKYPHLYGNYGGAWYWQGSDFASFCGPVLMTTNCIIPVLPSYADRIFTTGAAGYPGVPHIPDRPPGGMKDFSKIIALAKTCPPPRQLENGELVCGFAHGQVCALADRIAEAVRSGTIRRFIVMAGCDGRQSSRSYYSGVAAALPPDTVILTAGCAKYRYHKLVSREIGGIPAVLDAGQCNDCYSIVLIALKLKEIFGLDDLNKLPLSFDIAWYEQKAVAVLLALLALGFRKIRLGPTFPAFLTPDVIKVLAENFDIRGITTPEKDVADMMNGK